MAAEIWDSGHAYEQYAGRWSRKIAPEFLRWLGLPRGLAWADVGCGTGALSSTILAMCEPASIRGIDSSAEFVAQAQQRITASRVSFETGDATCLPWDSGVCDIVASGLVLNFVPEDLLRQGGDDVIDALQACVRQPQGAALQRR